MGRFCKIVLMTFIASLILTTGNLMNTPELLAKGEDVVTPINVSVKAPFPIDQKLSHFDFSFRSLISKEGVVNKVRRGEKKEVVL